MTKRTIKCEHSHNIKECTPCWSRFIGLPVIVVAAVRKNGVVFTGDRHGHIIRDMVKVGFIKNPIKDYVHQSEQGFVDNFNQYHSREEARQIAIEAQQITAGHGTLYSEDLW